MGVSNPLQAPLQSKKIFSHQNAMKKELCRSQKGEIKK